MAELAAGAVSSLLGVLRNEALLLRRVGHDVEFIKEEMESMNSFLEHLARTTPPGGEHDEQVRTWMKQVRDLAHDCSNCIDRYLQRGDPAIHRARSGLRRYAWWAYWLVQEMLAQHAAAVRLRELKERARDVGNRRVRYGVELPRKSPEGADMLAGREYKEGEGGGGDDDDDVHNQVMTVAAYSSDARRRALEPCTLEDYCTRKLAEWLELQANTKMEGSIPSISIVVPDAARARAIAREAQDLAQARCFQKSIWIDLPNVQQSWDLPLLTREILSYILHECEGDHRSHYDHRRHVFNTMWEKADGINVHDKIKEVGTKIGEVEKKIVEAEGSNNRADEGSKSSIPSEEPLGVLLHALRLNTEGPHSRQEQEPLSSLGKIVNETAEMLKWHMEAVSAAAGKEPKKPPICLHVTQYEDILQKVYPNLASGRKLPEEAGDSATSATGTPTDLLPKEVTHNHKITLEVIRELPPEPQLLPGDAKDQTKEGQPVDKIPSENNAKDQTKEGQPVDKIPSENKKTRLVIKGTVDMVTLDMIGGAAAKSQASTDTPGGKSGIKNRAIAAAVKEAKESLPRIEWPIRRQLMIKGIVDEIKKHLEGKKTLIILQDEKDYVSRYWEETRKTLGLLGDLATAGSSVAVIIITSKNEKAEQYCYPQGEPIIYSLVGLYHNIVIQLTSLQQAHAENEDGSNNSKILRAILDKCDPHEFCMKMFAHALYANPNRSKEELKMLLDTLQHPKKSLATNAKKIFKFSYRDLPREHKTCLLYLAIFPQGHKISRSILIGRWLTEGLITKEDWPAAVRHAERCFDALIDRWLLWPGDIGVAGRVKSCVLGDLIHGFITKAAKKQHILDARLSHLWAHHFSIFSGLRLRASDSIDKFVKKLPTYSPQLPSLKLLDLEGCHCLDKNRRYLKDICSRIFLVKYLSLRGTNITYLPTEINNLHELEVLDIRKTKVNECATRDIVLLKLRRLLAGHVDPRASSDDKLVRDDKSFSYVRIPHKIEKMENMEVLSKVKASRKGRELKDIRKLWQLRKLGVVIDDNEDHLRNFLRAIGDLNDCLQSLSITIPETTSQGANPDNKKFLQKDIYNRLIQPPKLLESLSINGSTQRVKLLSLLATGGDELAKVTLSRTLLKEENLTSLAELPKLHCVRLRHNAYSGKELTFKENDFMHLKYFIVEGTNIPNIEKSMTETDIKFEDEAAPELEKIVLSFTNIRSLCGIGRLKKLKDLELTRNKFLLSFSHDGATHNENTDSGVPKQNNQSGAPEQKTQNKTPLQNTQNKVVEQNTQNGAVEQNTQNEAPQQNSQSRAVEQNTQSRAVEQNIQNEAPQQNTQSRAIEQNTQDGAPEQSAESGAMEQNTQNTATEKNTQNKAPEQKTQSRFIFEEKEFEHLKYFHVEDDKITNIIFKKGAAPKLEKIVLSLTNGNSNLTGVRNLSKLKEIELIGGKFLLSSFHEADRITKVTLRDTHLKKDDLKSFPMKPNLRCLELSENSYDENQISLDENEFPNLDLLIVDCSKINSIGFSNKSAPNLEKIVWSFKEMKALSGINYLPKLQELELNGEIVPREVRKDIIAHKGQHVLTHKKPQQQDQEKRSTTEEDDEEGFSLSSCFSRIKNQQ
ncbi:uncharacterized protein [Setaria viridis]|uniref:uncharacterized protein n=1 Tax=Setaria viridis TaxID=4556 RepID=UPI003B3AB860